LENIRAEIISIGNEILAGWTLNTNAHWIAQKCRDIGLAVQWMTTIADTEEEIKSALQAASSRANVILCTGGLGPTPDDITKNTIASFFNTDLVLDEQTLAHVRTLFAKRNIDMPDINRMQAFVPKSATIIENPIGTAPGLLFQKQNRLFFFMPGVPKEMKKMVETEILSTIKSHFNLLDFHIYIFRTSGIAESRLFEKLEHTLKKYEDIPLSFLPKITGVDIKIKIVNTTADVCQRTDNFLSEIRSCIQKYIYSEQEKDLQEIIGEILRSRKLTLAIAESFTGGLISDWITDIPGSSDYFLGSMTTYSNESKIRELGVSEEALKSFGAVSEQTAREMAMGVKRVFGADCAIATTGIAGPGGATKTKPVGLCYLSAVYNDKTFVKEFHFGTGRRINKERGAMAALESLRRLLLDIS
jgi:nicotinamide-nucleotide amidase